MTPEERQANTKAAHDAVRGMKRTHDDLAKRALGKERSGKFGSLAERELYPLLADSGIPVTIQKAVDVYTLDFALGNTVAVEVNGRDRKLRYWESVTERTKYLLDLGWNIVYVWATKSRPATRAAADYIIALYEQTSRDPTLRGQYRVIRCDGKLLASGGVNDDEFPGVLTAIPSTWARTTN
jgi:very-short-patch-repair endonuclease